MRSRWVELILVIAGVAVAFTLMKHRRAPAPEPEVYQTKAGATTLDGLAPGVTYEEMVHQLGEPTCRGVSPRGRYAEYGSKVLTWNGQPSVSFKAAGAATIIGKTLRFRGSTIQVGDPVGTVEAAQLKPRQGREVMEHHNTAAANTTEYDVDCGVAVITTDSVRVTHILLTDSN